MSKRQASIVTELKKAIKAAERRGVTRSKIAAAAGIPRSQLGRIADGENVPRLDSAERILAAIQRRLTIVPK